MAINPDAVGVESAPRQSSWTSTDSILYALGVGAGMADPTGAELEFTTENSIDIEQKALPTMAVVLGGAGGAESPLRQIGDVNYALLVHGEQSVRLHKPLPFEATVTSSTKIANIYDKGKAALVVLETSATDDADGAPLFTSQSLLFFRGEGGWGGDPGPQSTVAIPDRDADQVVSYATRADQALLYRLNGDRNPLHSDPQFAAKAGFDKPILHGLCTYGVTGRALVHACCDGDPANFKGMDARFSSPVMPGEQLDVHVWDEGDSTYFRTTATDGRTVIDNGVLHT